MDNIAVREEYINRLRKLQEKRKDKAKDFVILALFIVMFTETMTSTHPALPGEMDQLLPFIVSNNKPKTVVNAIDRALDGKGKFVKYLDRFAEENKKVISYYTNIIPRKPLNYKDSGDSKLIKQLKEKTDLLEQSNNMTTDMNYMLLGKKMKQWNTQRDSRVRKTVFHTQIDRIVVPIGDYFQVGSHRALYPAHRELPDFDRINCRCYLTFY